MELDKPVIGAVAGAAVAGGMELALWCGMRIVGVGAYFGVYYRRWGVPRIDCGTLPERARCDEIIARSRLG